MSSTTGTIPVVNNRKIQAMNEWSIKDDGTSLVPSVSLASTKGSNSSVYLVETSTESIIIKFSKQSFISLENQTLLVHQQISRKIGITLRQDRVPLRRVLQISTIMNGNRSSHLTPTNGIQDSWMGQLPGGLQGLALSAEERSQLVPATPSDIMNFRVGAQEGGVSTYDEENYLTYGVANPNEVFQQNDDVNDLLANVNDPFPVEGSLDFGSYLDDSRSPGLSGVTSGYSSASYEEADPYGQPMPPLNDAYGYNPSQFSQSQSHLLSSNETLGIGSSHPGAPLCDQGYSSILYTSDQTMTPHITFPSDPSIVYPSMASNGFPESTGMDQQNVPFQLPAEPPSLLANGSSSTASRKGPKHRHQRVYGLPEDEQKDRTRELNKEAARLSRQRKKKEAKEAEALEVEERQRKIMELYKQL